jgi:hypothetical protein
LNAGDFGLKRFCSISIAQMVNIKLFDDFFVRIWLERSSVASKCRESLLSELHAFITSLTNGDPPALGEDPLSLERTLLLNSSLQTVASGKF